MGEENLIPPRKKFDCNELAFILLKKYKRKSDLQGREIVELEERVSILLNTAKHWQDLYEGLKARKL